MKQMRIIAFALVSLVAISSQALAEYLDPEVKTQVNEQTSFFKDSVGNMAEVEKEIKASISNTEKAQEDVIGLSNMMESLAGGAKGAEIQKMKNDLAGISADDLADKGRSKMMEENLLEQLYPDEDVPLMKQHKKDVDFIVNNHKKLLGNLLDVLKQHGLHVDCKQIKGSKVVEPGYMLQVEKQVEQELDYDKKTCEEPRNRYSCSDRLTVRCTKKGMEWGEWQHKGVQVPGSEMLTTASELLWQDYVARNHFEMKIFKWPPDEGGFLGRLKANNPSYVESKKYPIRAYLARKHGKTLDNIGDITGTGWYGGLTSVQGDAKNHVWGYYNIEYWYRDGNEICLEWQETWSEDCRF